MRIFLTLILIVLVCQISRAILYQVGPGKPYPNLQAVTGLLNPGDIVEVDGDETYPGGVVFNRAGAPANKIIIRGIRINGNRPILSGGTNTVHFSTPWPYNVPEGGHHYIFEGFEITGGSFRGLFHQARDLTIRDCYIHDCPAHGLLGADQGSGSLLFEYSEVANCGSGSSQHQVYMATDQFNNPGSVFRMQYCYIHDATGGNNVKSRAERNEIYFNWVEGAYYHELELIGADFDADQGNPALAREDSDVVGNVLIKRLTSANNDINFPVVRIGGDGTGESSGRYRFVNNTIICGTGAVFRIFHALQSAEFHNNVLYNPAGLVQFKRTVEADWTEGMEIIAGQNNWLENGTIEVPAGLTGTVFGADPGFQDLGADQLFPDAGSPLINGGLLPTNSPAGYPFPNPLASPTHHPPQAAWQDPEEGNERFIVDQVDMGAFEFPTILSVNLNQWVAKLNPEDEVLLTWNAQGEEKLRAYLIQRSADGTLWDEIGTVSPNVNSISSHTYEFLDKSPNPGVNFYRLKMENLDGSFTFSSIKTVLISSRQQIKIYPNPANDFILIDGEALDKVAEIHILDESGGVLYSERLLINSEHLIRLHVGQLSSGSYIVQLLGNQGVWIESIQFVKN